MRAGSLPKRGHLCRLGGLWDRAATSVVVTLPHNRRAARPLLQASELGLHPDRTAMTGGSDFAVQKPRLELVAAHPPSPVARVVRSGPGAP
mmetsp:Transcript_19389/g.34557  ORF Transcript_19389/g.34557 Transcript_19389/m.34557 type:complete len:91 (+) Transcript_19389:288-560(+)